MMIHFVYPNVKVNNKEKKFIGCGRYAMLLSREEGYEVADPKTPNLTNIHNVVSILAPEFDPTKNVLYERKENPTGRYMGESLDLAYLLALINCSRKVKVDIKHDIWCTGSIDWASGLPFLNAVKPVGFDIKLRAFLSEDNRDNLFIIPMTNIQAVHAALFQETDVNVVSVSQFQNLSSQEISEGKTIIKVRGDELKALVDCIFDVPANFEASANEVHDKGLIVRTWQYQTGSKVGAVAIDTDGKTVVAGTFGRKVLCLDEEGHLRWQKKVEKECWCVALSPDGQTAIVGTWNKFPLDDKKRSLFCFDGKGSQLWQDTSTSSVWALAFSTDGKTIVAGMSDELVLFDIEGKRFSLQKNKGIIFLLNTWTMAVALSANGEIVAAGTGSDKHVRVFKQNGALLGDFGTQGSVYTIAVSANGESIAAGDTDGYVYWLSQKGKLVWKKQFADKIQAVAFDSDGQHLWFGTGKKDGHLQVYNNRGSQLWRHHVGGSISSLALSVNSDRAVVGTEKGGIFLFNNDGTLPYQTSIGSTVRSVAISATGEKIVAGSLDGVIYSFHLQQ